MKIADKATMDTIDFNDILILEFNASGVVVGAKTVSDSGYTTEAAYFTSQNGNTLSCSTAINNKGIVFNLTLASDATIYNVNGNGDDCGKTDTLQENDKLIAIKNEKDEAVCVFIVERSVYDLKHDDHCVCTGTAVGVGSHTCDTNTTDWEAWTDPYSLPTSGKYYLTCDVQITRNGKDDGDARVVFDVADNLTICLHGYTVDVAAGFRFNNLYKNVTVNICDCEGTGTINSARRNEVADLKLCQLVYTKADYDGYVAHHTFNVFGGTWIGTDNCSTAGIFAMNGEHTLNIYGGVFKGGECIGKPTVYPNGSVMYLQKGAVCNMYGGTIQDGMTVANTMYPDYLGSKGGQVYIDKGTFNMYGGTITGGKATSTDASNPGMGGNIFVASEGALNLYGGTITGGEAGYGANILIYKTGTIKIVDVTVTTSFTAEATATVDTSAVATGVTVTHSGIEYTVTKAAG